MGPASQNFLGSLSRFQSRDETTHIGTRFPDDAVQISKILRADDSDALVTDLANLVSQRGVVFFTNQDLTIADQKELITRMGLSTGNKPKSSTLHKHPISETTSELGDEVSIISSERFAVRIIRVPFIDAIPAANLPRIM